MLPWPAMCRASVQCIFTFKFIPVFYHSISYQNRFAEKIIKVAHSQASIVNVECRALYTHLFG